MTARGLRQDLARPVLEASFVGPNFQLSGRPHKRLLSVRPPQVPALISGQEMASPSPPLEPKVSRPSGYLISPLPKLGRATPIPAPTSQTVVFRVSIVQEVPPTALGCGS